MPISAFHFELKSVDEQGVFEGWASTYDNVDQGGDVCIKGCFTDTLAASKTKPLLYGHRDPVGTVTLEDNPKGLIARGRLTMAVQQAKDCYELMKAGALTGLSIGYQTLKENFVDGARQLQTVKLFEVSLVAMPMNESAMVTSVKSAQDQQQIVAALKSFRQEIIDAIRERKN